MKRSFYATIEMLERAGVDCAAHRADFEKKMAEVEGEIPGELRG